jgi:hypothetical protein
MSRYFVRKLFVQLLCVYNFWFVIFWQKGFGTKAVNKMLVKLTPVVAAWIKDMFCNFYFMKNQNNVNIYKSN